MARTHKWEDLARRTLGDAEYERIRADARAEIEKEYREAIIKSLREAREMAGKTQSEVAALVEVSQAELSRVEARADHKLSTLRRYIEALGGELEVIARFGDKTLRLHGV